MSLPEERSAWDRLVDKALEAFDAGDLDRFRLPRDIAALAPRGYEEQARTAILAAAFQVWLRKEFRQG